MHLRKIIVAAAVPLLWQTVLSAQNPFYVYHAFHSPDNHFVPSGWMGDYGDIRLDDHWQPKGEANAKTVIRIAYSAESKQQNGWAGIYWQNPPNNWASRPGGYNLNGMTKLVLKARGEKGGEKIEEFKVGGLTGDYADSATASIGPIILAKNWKEYEIPLDEQELSSITGGFCWTIDRAGNPDGAASQVQCGVERAFEASGDVVGQVETALLLAGRIPIDHQRP